ncbi:MAG: ABC transporter ATP-binding protein [Anderseniella sp.]
MSSAQAIKTFLQSIWQVRPALVGTTAVLMLVRSFLEGLGLLMVIPLLALSGVVDSGASSGAVVEGVRHVLGVVGLSTSFSNVLLIFLGLMLVRACVGLLQVLASVRLQTNYLHHLRMSIYTAITQANWLHLAMQDSARLNHALSLQAEHAAYGLNAMLRLVSAGVAAFISLLIALSIEPVMSGIILLLAGIVAIPIIFLDIRHHKLSRRVVGAIEEMFASLGTQLVDIKLLKAMSSGGEAEKRFSNLADEYREAGLARGKLGALAAFSHEVAGALLLVGLVYFAVSQVSVMQVGPVAVAIIFARLFPAARALQNGVRDVFTVLPAWVRISETIERAALEREPAYDQASMPAPAFTNRLCLENVSYRYPQGKADILSGIDFELKAGTSLGLVGLSGAGKTTLLDILSGLVTPTSGAVMIDGCTLNDATRLSWRGSVAYVVQDAQVSNESVRDNVAKYRSGIISDEVVWAALAQAGAREIIEALPGGLDERLGDRGQRLSRGQRQRIALARALYARPRLLVLDEATSALNVDDEKAVIDNIQSLLPETTIIVVTHRLSSVEWVDQLLELKDGKLNSLHNSSVGKRK